MSLPSAYDVIVAGAGIVGASIAWHLSRKGLDVSVIDSSGPSAGATGASDGAVSVATKTPGMLAELAAVSLAYCRELAEPGGLLANVFETRPSFLFARCDVEIDALDKLSTMLADRELLVEVARDGPPEASAVRGLSDRVVRVLELAGEGHMLGYNATRAFLADSGAICRWPCRLGAFHAGCDGVSLFTDRGEMRAAKLVLATGTGSERLVPHLPLIARSGQLLITERSHHDGRMALPGSLTSAAYLLDKSLSSRATARAPVVIDPLATGQLLIGSSREDGGSEAQTDFDTVRRILASGVAVLPSLSRHRVIRVFAGVRTATADGIPIIGEMPDTPNVILATGFEGDGICLAPLVGREVAAMIAGEAAGAEIGHMSPARLFPKKVANR